MKCMGMLPYSEEKPLINTKVGTSLIMTIS